MYADDYLNEDEWDDHDAQMCSIKRKPGMEKVEHMRNVVVSQRSGGVSITQSGTPFTVPVTAGVPTLINPLLPSAVVQGVLWTADGNNRATPNYTVAMPTTVIPVGYKKFTEFEFTFAADKSGPQDQQYLFQLEVDGTPVGLGVTVTVVAEPQVITLYASSLVSIDSAAAAGLAVTGVGTSDDIQIESFEMAVLDFQTWTDPDA